ncbi:hypothetical protein [Chamaesiphon sp.]|uniref:hypothetical protein n=1 Tax=Chamaesiphon sp. TaxID=2814140 RepID=UPI0035936ECF
MFRSSPIDLTSRIRTKPSRSPDEIYLRIIIPSLSKGVRILARAPDGCMTIDL